MVHSLTQLCTKIFSYEFETDVSQIQFLNGSKKFHANKKGNKQINNNAAKELCSNLLNINTRPAVIV